MLRKLLYTFIGLVCLAKAAEAQITAYTFTAASGTFSSIKGAPGATSPTLTAVTAYPGALASDDGFNNNVTLPFTFGYDGVSYTKVGVNSNGYLYLGGNFPSATSAGGSNALLGTGASTASIRPIIAPIWEDFDIQANNNLNVLTSGVAPNRVFTVEWTNALWQWGAAAAAISFQVKLYETTNAIEFIYTPLPGALDDSNPGDLGASIGITAAASGSGNFLSLNNTSASPTVSSTVETSTIVTKPAAGQIYRFTPPCTATVYTSDPTDTTVCAGENTSFTTSASGFYNLKWQVSTDGGNVFSDITNAAPYSGVTDNMLVITSATASLTGNMYRAVLSNACTPDIFSDTATLNVYSNSISISVAPYTKLLPGITTTLTALPSPVSPSNTITWMRDGIPVVGANSNTLVVDLDGMGKYRAMLTTSNGCSSTSNEITITDSVSSRLFIYPSPTRGHFQVRYYSLPSNVLPRNVTIYDSKGSLISTNSYTVNKTYGAINIDLTHAGRGIYWVELGDFNGQRIAVGRVIVL